MWNPSKCPKCEAEDGWIPGIAKKEAARAQYEKAAELTAFLAESNRIEGIVRPVTEEEIDAAEGFLALDSPEVSDLVRAVGVFQPGARLRDRVGLDVRVGAHRPPPGSPKIRTELASLLRFAATYHPYATHHRYESLHPFTDGNGRTGRLLWAWQMLKQERWPGLRLGFLHAFYYQTLEGGRE